MDGQLLPTGAGLYSPPQFNSTWVFESTEVAFLIYAYNQLDSLVLRRVLKR